MNFLSPEKHLFCLMKLLTIDKSKLISKFNLVTIYTWGCLNLNHLIIVTRYLRLRCLRAKKTDEFFGEVDIYYYSVSADIYMEKAISDTFELKVKYQGCADAGLCYPPIFKNISIKKRPVKIT